MIASIALDLGTTSIKAGLLDQHGTLGHIIALPAPEVISDNGRYESDALQYAATAEKVLAACLAQTSIKPHLGLCSQRSSFLIWEKSSGRPVTPLISWQDNRGAASCNDVQAQESVIRNLTGLRLTPYYFAPKLRTVLQQHPHWRSALEHGELLVGTLDTFLIWRWTSGKHHVTDASMAARTLLLDIQQQQWSPLLGKIFDIPLNILPQIKPSASMNVLLDNGLTLQASVGDQSAALIASVAADSAQALVNLGTGGFVIRYLPENNKPQGGYLRTLVYQDSNLQAHIALEGTLNSIAAALAPYPVNDCPVESLAAQEIFCLAEPSGIGAPYFRNDLGMQFSQPVNHLTPHQVAALLLEGIIFRVARIVEDFQRESPVEHLYLSGGLSELTCLQQGLAQCVPCVLFLLQQKDSSLQGAALLAAGMMPASHRAASKIAITQRNPGLPKKYQRWKNWFDSML